MEASYYNMYIVYQFDIFHKVKYPVSANGYIILSHWPKWPLYIPQILHDIAKTINPDGKTLLLKRLHTYIIKALKGQP